MKNRLAMIAARKEHYYPKLEQDLLNKYLGYKGNTRVFIRMRPIFNSDLKAYGGTPEQVEQIKKGIQIISKYQLKIEPEKTASQLFNFDHVFGNESTQNDVYDEV